MVNCAQELETLAVPDQVSSQMVQSDLVTNAEINNLKDGSYINYVAHISGGAIGGIFGLYFLLFRRSRLKAARRPL